MKGKIICWCKCSKMWLSLREFNYQLQWAPPNRITLGHEQFDSNNRIWLIDTIIRIFVIYLSILHDLIWTRLFYNSAKYWLRNLQLNSRIMQLIITSFLSIVRSLFLCPFNEKFYLTIKNCLKTENLIYNVKLS